jgi:hypothetical protein
MTFINLAASPATPRSSSRLAARTWRVAPAGRLRPAAFDFLEKPGTGIGPKRVGLAGGNAECLGCLIACKSREMAELHQLRGLWIGLGQKGKGFVQGEKVLWTLGRSKVGFIEILPFPTAAVFEAAFAPGGLDQDPAHRHGRRGVKMPFAFELLGLLHIHEPDVGLVDQVRRLQCLTGLFLAELLCRQLTQLIVDQRQELSGSRGVAPLDRVQYLGNIAHKEQK